MISTIRAAEDEHAHRRWKTRPEGLVQKKVWLSDVGGVDGGGR
jgi:hypothetical protein